MKKHENKFSKRAFAILLALALCMGMLPFTAVAVDDHEHEYEESCGRLWGTFCTTSHKHYFVCSCGDKYTEWKTDEHSLRYTDLVDKDGGKYHSVFCNNDGCNYAGGMEAHWSNAEATCTSAKICVCGNVMEPARDHEPGEWITTVEATCVTNGTKVQSCTQCGEVLNTETIPADGKTHNFGGAYVEAKTATGGLGHAQKCQNDGCTQLNMVTPHKLTTTTTPAACGKDGSVVTKCEVCSYTSTKVLEALKHDWSIVETTPATCTKDGFTVNHCARCGLPQETSRKVLKATGHQFSAWTLDIAGYVTHSRACTVCGEKETAPHIFGEWVIDDENKTKTQTCETCGYSVTESTSTECKHPYTERTTEEKAPTCTEDGYKTVTCTKCDTVIEHTDSPASGHSFGEWVQVSDILRTRTCTVCGFVEEERLPGPELPPVIDITPPVEPVDPVDPIDPVDPVDPDDGDGDVDIDDPDVPLGPGPGDTEEPDDGDEDIDDPDVPLGPGPGGDEDGDDTSGQQPGGSDNKPQNPGNSGNGGEDGDDEIEDEPVPLAATPKTGDNQSLLWVLFLVSGAALTGLVFAEKKRGEQ